MMTVWQDVLTVPDLMLITGITTVNLYLWISLASEVREWRRRRQCRNDESGWFRHRLPARSPLPLTVTALGTGLISIWMMAVLLPLI